MKFINLNLFRTKKNKNRELYPEDIFYESLNMSNLNKDKLEGNFEKMISFKVYMLLGLMFILIVFLFVYKIYILQIQGFESWFLKSHGNFTKEYPLFANRGSIKDRNGILLAWNVEGINNSKSSFLNNDFNKDGTKVNNIDEFMKGLNNNIKREYIKDYGFSNVLGYYVYPKKDSKGVYWKEYGHGVGGIEGYYNDILSGSNGKVLIPHDALGNIVKDSNFVDPGENGKDITLTIDSRIQKIYHDHLINNINKLGFNGGAGMMVNFSNGEILSMATFPEYDNNLWTNRNDFLNSENLINKDLKDKSSPLLDRNTQLSFVPGSIVKPFVGYAVLNENVIDKYANIFSSGKITIKNIYGGPDTVFRDWKLEGHGYVDLKEALAVSSDEYFYQTVGGYKKQEGIGIEAFTRYMNDFYFSSLTNIDFVGEVKSQIPSIELKKKLTGDNWLLGNTYHAAIGQDDWRVTPVSILRSLSFIALDGEYNQFHLFKDSNDIVSNTVNKNNIINNKIKINLEQNHIDSVKEGLFLVTEDGGTGHWFKQLPFKVYAKTGTAQLGSKNEYTNSWVIGYWKSKTDQYYGFIFLMEKGPESNTVSASKIMKNIFDDILKSNLINKDDDII